MWCVLCVCFACVLCVGVGAFQSGNVPFSRQAARCTHTRWQLPVAPLQALRAIDWVQLTRYATPMKLCDRWKGACASATGMTEKREWCVLRCCACYDVSVRVPLNFSLQCVCKRVPPTPADVQAVLYINYPRMVPQSPVIVAYMKL